MATQSKGERRQPARKTAEQRREKQKRKVSNAANRTQDKLTPKMKLYRDKFIAEYIIDFNGTQAALRAGIPAASAGKRASELLREPYVAQKVMQFIDTIEEETLINRNRVIAGLVREANWLSLDSSHAARVSAWGKLSKILGMERTTIDHNVRSSGVMYVPLADSDKEWERAAQSSQKELKANVRD